MELTFYSSEGWESWGLSGKPTIPEGMAFLVDDDLLFEDGRGVRATAVVLPEGTVPYCPMKPWRAAGAGALALGSQDGWTSSKTARA
ncbi:hypothetical protein ACGFWD_44955 [Streptomyces sp. NPDC048448]|uniref:Uncharacterized protein n=1 Tax=Streptomyces kaempferi TaxID=333725 RepID=A0ABW3XYJ5_9ACTN|nr:MULTISPECIES: hypothetical protein [unclassified Streptomyces]QIY60392.1 hypothetical protein HEP85_39105 [Streptomyces sp. RPA4-2]